MPMSKFKESLKTDLKNVFHNSEEFADYMTIYYDREKYENIPVIIDRQAKERNKKSSDHETIIYSFDVTAYIHLSDLGFVPRKNHTIQIGSEEYSIVTAKEEMGEIILELVVYDE